MPAKRSELGFWASFTQDETVRLLQGFVPDPAVDWWFICAENGWLNFHRSDSGLCIYALRLERNERGSAITESWINADPRQHASEDRDYDRRLLRYLIDVLLLEQRDVMFPMPADADGASPDEVHHAYVRRGPGGEPVHALAPATSFALSTESAGCGCVVAAIVWIASVVLLLASAILPGHDEGLSDFLVGLRRMATVAFLFFAFVIGVRVLANIAAFFTKSRRD